MKEKIKIAIYSRKSKFAVKGDSIGNQIELINEYIDTNYPSQKYDVERIVYEDEGFSGGNLRRPQFQKFLNDERQSPYNMIICYRLDRISRNLADFTSLMNELTELDTSFVSIKEQFDTKTPMGRAMMYIASVFAQLEREVIAERIRDNMLELSKTGIWLGGTSPIGYKTESYSKVKVCSLNEDNVLENKTIKACKLVIDEEEKKIVKLIFNKYLELKSLAKLETYLLQNNVKSRRNINFSTITLRLILTNLTYVQNDIDIKNYYDKKGVQIYTENDGRQNFDGNFALMPYNRTSCKRKAPINDWIISVGLHSGIVSGKEFIAVQTLLEKNADKKYRAALDSSKNTVMVGLLKCKKCGSYMRPKNFKKRWNFILLLFVCFERKI